MITLLLIGISVFLSFLIWYKIRYKKDELSISNIYYGLPEKPLYLRLLFTLFSWGYGIPLAIVSASLTGSGIMFFAGLMICFVGVSPNFRRNKLDSEVHMKGAAFAVILSQLSIIFEFHMWPVALVSLVLGGGILMLGKKKIMFEKTYIYWAEAIMIVIAYGVVFYEVLKFMGIL